MPPVILKPQKGPQENFLKSAADIVLFGGGAGGGKSYGILLEPLRHVTTNKKFSAVFFRRSTVQIRNPGGLWDESTAMYSLIPGTKPLQVPLEWHFAGGGKIKMSHLEHEHSVLDWQGSQIPLIIFDELTHFTASQFWYMLSRNRSVSGVRGYIRATCNPDADSWVAELIAWWIDQNTGYPIPERSGVVRWFARIGGLMHWADDPATIVAQYPKARPKSFTFIGSKLSDNPALTSADPDYEANLEALPLVERERLLGGNWKIRPAAGLYFQRKWANVIPVAPAGMVVECRGWDVAATPDTGTNDPDWTVGVRTGRTRENRYVVLDAVRLRGSPRDVLRLLKSTAASDGKGVRVSLPQDPGAAGKTAADLYIKELAGYTVSATPESRNLGGDGKATATQVSAKVSRFGPFSAQCEADNVDFVAGDHLKWLFDEMEAFPEAKHDDSCDAASRAFATVALLRGRMTFSKEVAEKARAK